MVTGIEYNPFIRFVAETKAAITLVTSYELEQAIAKLEEKTFTDRTLSIPLLTTLHNRRYSDKEDVQTLLSAYACVSYLEFSAPIKAMLHLGIAAAIDDIFHLRKDGRALRYVQKQGNAPADMTIRSYWRSMLEDVQQYELNAHRYVKSRPLFTVYRGSASNLKSLYTSEGIELCLPNNAFDTIMYSPPISTISITLKSIN